MLSAVKSLLSFGQETPEQGDAGAQYNLGWIYALGRGVPENDAEAVKWFRLAAEQGHASAQFNLGVKYTNGEGVLRSGAAAADWFYKAGLAYLELGETDNPAFIMGVSTRAKPKATILAAVPLQSDQTINPTKKHLPFGR